MHVVFFYMVNKLLKNYQVLYTNNIFMKRKYFYIIVILSVLLMLNFSAFSQVYGHFKYKRYPPLQISEYNLLFFISLYSNNEYTIEISEKVCETYCDKFISYGTFYQKNDTLILKDKIHNFIIYLLYKDNRVKVIKSFSWMKNLNYYFFVSADYKPVNYKLKEPSINILKKNTIYQRNNKQNYIFKTGKYIAKSYWYVNALYLSPDNTYKIIFKDIILSEGIWKRNKNVIELWDTSIKHTFYLLTKKDGTLESSYIPGDDEGEIFYYHKE